MIIRAIFKGTNSLGYEKGKEYMLNIPNNHGTKIERLDGSGKCEYTSLSAFLKNWDNIRNYLKV